jgi:hypothetical protein
VHYDPTSAAAIQALAQGETATDSFIYTLETTTKSGAQSHLSQATVTVLSLDRCALFNPNDRAARAGPGPRFCWATKHPISKTIDLSVIRLGSVA